ncbi:MAG: C25 family cysteine peptidase [Bryobacteraceae bacterium]|jgi:hypothetical protein
MKTEVAIVKKSNRTETSGMILRGVAFCLALLVVFVLPAWPQGILFDSSASGTTGTVTNNTSIGWTHTIVGAGTSSNGLLIVTVGENSGTQYTPTCTEAGTTMTLMSTPRPIVGSITLYTFYRAMGTLSAGGISISCTLGGSTGATIMAGVSAAYYNVNQTTPFDTSAEVSTSYTTDLSTITDTTPSASKLNNGYVVYDVADDDDTLNNPGTVPPTATAASGQNARGMNYTDAAGIYNFRLSGSDSKANPNNGSAPNTTTMTWTLGATTATGHLLLPMTPQNPGAGPTAVTVSSLTATPSGSGNLIKLQTGREINNLGFNIYREQNGQRVKLNSSLLAGSALLGGSGTTFTAGHTRTWQDDLPGGSGSVAYWVEEIDLSGASAWYGPAIPDAAPASKPTGMRAAGTTAAALRGGASGSAPAVSLSSIGRSATASTAVRAAAATPQNLQAQWALAADQALKLGVSSEGWYRVTQPQLVAAGLNPNVDPSRLQLYVNGVQQPILVESQTDGKFQSGDAIDFYGVGADTIWSGAQAYWLVLGNGPGLRIGSQGAANMRAAAGASSFPFTIQWQPRTVYFAALLSGGGNNFFGPVLDSGDPLSQALTITHLNTGAGGSSTLQVTLQGVAAGAHAVTVTLNGNFVGDMTFSDQNSSSSSFPVPNNYLQEGANALGLTVTGGAADVSVVDTVLLSYPHSYVADSDSLRMTAASGSKVTVSGFSGSWIQVIDITNPSAVSVTPRSVSGGTVTFTPQGGGTRTLLAVGSSQLASPASIAANGGSSWHSAQAGADMVIISHASLLGAAQKLAALRQSQGHTVQAIDVQDLYNEFNFGVESPYAIQSFLSAAQANWTTKPAFVLLMGNGTLDPRNYLGTAVPDLVPVKLVDTASLETASDDWFADFNNNGVPEMAIGRIPAETVADATNAVNRLMAYDESGGGSAKNRALLVAGVDQDPTDNFEGYTAAVQALLPGWMAATQVLAGSDSQAPAEVKAGLNSGASLVNYVGHGSTEIWADGLLSSADAAGLSKGGTAPVVLSMTCLNGYFQDVYTNALGKALLNASQGGAAAVWASSGLTGASPQSDMNQAMVKALYGGAPGTTIGQAAMAAKSATTDMDVRRTWILFGDPAMKLQ